MTLTEHFSTLKCTDVREGLLTIGTRHVFRAAMYTDRGQRRLYVLGQRPPVMLRSRKLAFRINDAPEDWYLVAHMDYVKQQFTDWHPFGVNFMLGVWSVPSGEAIDKYNYWRGDHKPYRRIPSRWSE